MSPEDDADRAAQEWSVEWGHMFHDRASGQQENAMLASLANLLRHYGREQRNNSPDHRGKNPSAEAMAEPRDLPRAQTSPEHLAAYISKVVEDAEAAGKNAILVRVPEAFPLPLWEARQIIEALSAVARAEQAEARLARLRSAMDGLVGQIEAAEAHFQWVRDGSKGQLVPFHGDFVSASPAVMKRLLWWARELAAALAETARRAPGEPASREWLEKAAAREEGHEISVGGLASDLGMLKSESEPEPTAPPQEPTP